MGYIRFVDTDTLHEAKICRLSSTQVALTFTKSAVKNTNGFLYYKDPKQDFLMGDYKQFKTIHSESGKTVVYSCDGSAAEAPVIPGQGDTPQVPELPSYADLVEKVNILTSTLDDLLENVIPSLPDGEA